MRVELRKLAGGEQYYSFVYWDGEKRVRLKKSDHPNFGSREKAEEWARAKEAEVACVKARIVKRLQWKSQYYEYTKIVEDYLEECKRTQPNSWKNTAINLNQYVLPFFLDVKKANNLNNWSLHFEDFKKWLETDARTVKRGQKLIEYSTKNHCIKTLNTFLSYMIRHNLVDPSNVYRMSAFSSSKINFRDANHLISEDEFGVIHGNLAEINPPVATFFETAYWTGMRFNEIYGLSIDDIYMGEVEDGVLKTAMSDHEIEYYGYIVLESQPATKVRERLSNGTIKRKPLKGKPKISEKYNRVIPIIDKDLFNNLVRLFKVQQEKFKNRVYGSDPKNYVLFEDLTHTETMIGLRAAYARTKYSLKTYHCCRHTRCTELVGKTRDFVLAQMWLGHARQETTLRYTHIYQQSVRVARKKSQIIEFVD